MNPRDPTASRRGRKQTRKTKDAHASHSCGLAIFGHREHRFAEHRAPIHVPKTEGHEDCGNERTDIRGRNHDAADVNDLASKRPLKRVEGTPRPARLIRTFSTTMLNASVVTSQASVDLRCMTGATNTSHSPAPTAPANTIAPIRDYCRTAEAHQQRVPDDRAEADEVTLREVEHVGGQEEPTSTHIATSRTPIRPRGRRRSHSRMRCRR